ncbi:MAG TPA: CBS domain-containing protein [Streptosporangiaceae bacterium]|jgi:CBS domain-containing protein
MRKALVEDVMTQPVITVTESTPYKKIVATLIQHNISAVPVLDRTAHVKGIVSDADLVLKEADPDAVEETPLFEGPRRRREHRKSVGATAAELMSEPALTVMPTTTLEHAAQVMRKHRVRRMPVVDAFSGRLLGIVSRSDLLRVYLRPDEEICAEIQAEVLPRIAGINRRAVKVIVEDGVVTLNGHVDRQFVIRGLVHALHHVQGVVAVDEHLTYTEDDRYPTPPTFW